MANNTEPVLLEANIGGKIENIEIPDYSFKYPQYKNVSLATIKRSIEQPRLEVIHGEQEPDERDERLGYPIRITGNVVFAFIYILDYLLLSKVEKLKKTLIKDSTNTSNQVLKQELSCISGRENTASILKPKKEQFRYNRVRMVPNDWPNHGRLEVFNKKLKKIKIKIYH